MKAAIWTAYGPPEVLKLQEVEKPTPKDNEVLIKIHAASVFAGDVEARNLKFPILYRLPLRLYIGFRKPTRVTILGQEVAGEIESVGKNVTRLKEGDQVFASTGFRFGGYAEYTCLPGDSENYPMALKPRNMTYQQAAAVPVGGMEARHFIRQANIKSGEKVLINGAGGSIGTFAVQLAKNAGAEVTAVDSAGKLDMLRSLGADHVIDYKQQDLTKSGGTFDVIFDVVGKSSVSDSLRSLNQNGRYLVGNPSMSHMIKALFRFGNDGKQVYMSPGNQSKQDLFYLKEQIEEGKIRTVIDRVYSLDQIVEAHQYVESGEKKGNVILEVIPEDSANRNSP